MEREREGGREKRVTERDKARERWREREKREWGGWKRNVGVRGQVRQRMNQSPPTRTNREILKQSWQELN